MLYSNVLSVLIGLLSIASAARYEVVVSNEPLSSYSACASIAGKSPFSIADGWQRDDNLYYCIVNLDHETEPSNLNTLKIEFYEPKGVTKRDRTHQSLWSLNNKGYDGGPLIAYPLESLYRLYDTVGNGEDGLFTLNVYDGSSLTMLCSTTFRIGQPQTLVLNIALRSSVPKSFSDCDSSDVDSGMAVRFVDSGKGNPGNAYYDSIWICAQYRWNLPQGTDILQIGQLNGNNFDLIDETSKSVTTVRRDDFLSLELSIDDVNSILNGNTLATIRVIGEIDNSYISNAVDMNEFDFEVTYVSK